jgi:hypothetical protein
LAYLGSMGELQAQKGELVRIITHLVNIEDDK